MNRLLLAVFISLVAADCLAAGTAGQELDACARALTEGNFAEAARHAAASIGADDMNRETYLCQSRAYAGQNDRAHAIEALQAADRLSRTPLEHVVTLTLIGNQYLVLRRFDVALDHYRQSLDIAQANGDRYFRMVNLNQIGETLEGLGDYKAAQDNYQAALKLAANSNERADSSARIAAVSSAAGEHDKAIEYQIKALFLEERSGDFDHYANASLELGRIYLKAGQLSDAGNTLTKALERIRKEVDPYWEAKGSYYLALVKRAMGDTQGAVELLKNAKRLAEKIGASDIIELVAAATEPSK